MNKQAMAMPADKLVGESAEQYTQRTAAVRNQPATNDERMADIDPQFAEAHYGHDLFPPMPQREFARMPERGNPLGVKRVHPDARMPTYGTAGAACFDVAAVDLGTHTHLVQAGSAVTFRTGLAFDIPEGWAMLVFSRSGHGFKQDVRLANCVGVIDSDYTGELRVRLTADDHGPGIGVREGDRIAQCMLVRAPRWEFVEVEGELKTTARGAGGYGSTGR